MIHRPVELFRQPRSAMPRFVEVEKGDRHNKETGEA